MKFSHYKQSENKISFNAHSPLIEWFYRLKAKTIIRKIRKLHKIPKSIPITYTLVVNYDFNVGEENTRRNNYEEYNAFNSTKVV